MQIPLLVTSFQSKMLITILQLKSREWKEILLSLIASTASTDGVHFGELEYVALSIVLHHVLYSISEHISHYQFMFRKGCRFHSNTAHSLDLNT